MRRRRSTQTEIHSTIHKDIEIVFDNSMDIWRYTLRGRERSAGTLGKAIAEIDKPAPKGGKPFERIECMLLWKSDDEDSPAPARRLKRPRFTRAEAEINGTYVFSHMSLREGDDLLQWACNQAFRHSDV